MSKTIKQFLSAPFSPTKKKQQNDKKEEQELQVDQTFFNSIVKYEDHELEEIIELYLNQSKSQEQDAVVDLSDEHINYFKSFPFELVDILERGVKSIVYSCTQKNWQQAGTIESALKVLQYGQKYSSRYYKMARNEETILRHISHPNVVRLLNGGHLLDESNVPKMSYLQTELMSCSLEHVFGQGFFLSEHRAARLLEQIGSVLVYLHSHLIAHHDLCPANILLDRPACKGGLDQCVYKLCDFDTAQVYPNHCTMELLPFGDPRYMAPEKALFHQGYNPFLADSFSLGLIIIEAMTNFCEKHPEANIKTDFGKLLSLLNFRGLISEKLKNILFEMTNSVPDQRKNIEVLMKAFKKSKQ